MAAINVSDIERCGPSHLIVRSPSSSYIISSLVGCVVNAIFAIVGTILNSLVVFVLWTSPRLKKKISFFLIMILSSTDLAVTLVVHPLFLVNYVSEITGKAKCGYKIAYVTLLLILSGQSALILFTINIERYLSIVHPVFHRNQVTKRRCVAVLTILGFLITIQGIGRIFTFRQLLVLIVMEALLVCIGTCFIYVSIYRVTRKVLSPIVHTDVTTSHERQSPSTDGRKKMATILRELKMAKTAFLTVSCFLICYLPITIALGIRTTVQSLSLTKVAEGEIWTLSFATINSTLNCLIFFWSNRQLRQEWKRIMN